MASSSPFYGMAMFDFGDELDAPLNVQKEIDRFLLIDKQLFGLYSVFGNGVIDGWLVNEGEFSEETGINVTIDPGLGIIGFIASETTFPEVIEGLQPNSILNIYAVLQGDTVRDRFVDFTATTGTINSDFSVKIAEVVTGDNAIISINNDARRRIDFKQTIKEEIDSHRHRGTPSKIDLQDEVKNQLPGARIADIDAAKIATGVIPIEQVPILDHEDLVNSGLLTHAQLDSFVQSLSQSNKELLGEVSSVNQMKQAIFLKMMFPNVDEHFINELILIPGISPNAFIDFEASTAHIDLNQMCISGLPPSAGEFLSVSFDNSTAFNNAFELDDVVVLGENIILNKDEGGRDTVEDFEGVGTGGVAVPGFTLETEIVNDNLSVISEDADTLKTQGFFSGSFTSDRDFRAVFKKNLGTRDWSIYDEMVLTVKTLSETHGAVFAQFTDSSGPSDVFLLLSENEVTDNDDELLNNFAEKIFDITGQERGAVSEFTIFTEDTDSGFEFFIDDIHVRNQAQFKPQGVTRFRFTTGAPVTFHSLFFDIDTPTGTSAFVRARVASDDALLDRAPFTDALSSGEVFARSGTDIEIEITMLSDEDRQLTPTVNSLELRILASADFNGFNIDQRSEWLAGDPQNITITDEPLGISRLRLSDPINVGGISYSFADAIREIDDNNVGVFGFAGNKMPISPVQALDWLNNPFKKFEEPVSVVRRFNKQYLIADRDNDRVMEVDNVGNLIRGFGSVPVSDSTLYPFSSVYNPETSILTLIMSRAIDRTSIDLTKISLFIGASEIPLGTVDTLIESSKNTQIVEIQLSTDKVAALSSETSTGNVFINVAQGAFAQDINFNDNAAALAGIRGIEVFIGNFVYIDEIRHPVFVNMLENGNWVVANSSVFFNDPGAATEDGEDTDVDSTTGQTVPSIVEFNPDTQEVTFSSSAVTFSDFSLGAIFEQTENRLIVAGIIDDGNALGDAAGAADAAADGDQSTTDDTTTDTTGDATEGTSDDTTTLGTLNESAQFRADAVEKLASFRGTVVIIEKTSGSIVFKYMSPDGLYASDIDLNEDGNLVIAESNFSAASGRVIILDNFGNIVRLFGNGAFAAINDAKALEMGHLLISI